MVKQSSTLPELFLGVTDDGIHGADFLPDLEQNLHRGQASGDAAGSVIGGAASCHC
jgi:hypothetical protein